MNELTAGERTEWVSDARDALRGEMLLHTTDLRSAYNNISTHRVWRDAPASEVLREAYEELK